MTNEIEVRIEKVVYGGNGLGRVDGQTVFVPYTAPGDLVRARVVGGKKGYLRAQTIEILEAGPERREPPCPYFGPCGGCQLQHMTYPAQLAAKAGFVRETLARIGHVDWPGELPIRGDESHEFGYRTRATAHLGRRDEGAIFGYYAAHSHRIVDIHSCPLLVPELDAAWRAAREARGTLSRVRDLELVAGDGGVSAQPPIAQIGGRDLEVRVGEARFSFAPGVFFQVNRFLLGDLVATATAETAGAEPGVETADVETPPLVALDLYGGVGLFAVPLARRFGRVVLIEADERAAEHARQNCAANGAENVEVVAEPVERWLERTGAAPGSVDLALLDPPRDGAGPAVVRELVRLGPRRITYVSCDPSTLARDLRGLLDAGYRLDSLEAFDLFPQTFHVETVAKLVK